ncbi:MAG TPA: MFS transporter [Xanthobacteraceae bacterium]|jgi:MFS family permease|nr:MFS transporter [Xanthobacteraceae bacterium]
METPAEPATGFHPDSVHPDSLRSWLRLIATMLVSTIGGVGMWSVVVALPAVQAEFAVPRAQASLPFTLAMVGFAVGGIIMGRLLDRFGILGPLGLAAIALAVGYLCAASAGSLFIFALAHMLIGFGSSITLGPLMADISNWFVRRRGVAVTLCSAGNYLAGTFWPPLVQHGIAHYGWRETHFGIGLFSCAAMLAVGLVALRQRPPAALLSASANARSGTSASFGLSAGALQTLLAVASICCCVAMSMPQVHIVAYCGDLGYGVARGADMLALMMAFGVIGRIGSGVIADRVGGLPTLMLGSLLQAVALFLYLLYDGLISLYVISAVFGLFQGGIIPSYAIIVREYFPAKEAGTRVGIILMASLGGMALGGWLSGYIFDLTGSYRSAFFDGIVWNAVNGSVVLWMLFRRRQRVAYA